MSEANAETFQACQRRFLTKAHSSGAPFDAGATPPCRHDVSGASENEALLIVEVVDEVARAANFG